MHTDGVPVPNSGHRIMIGSYREEDRPSLDRTRVHVSLSSIYRESQSDEERQVAFCEQET